MNCRNWEERIALYAGGDLPLAEAVEVERHLGDCPGCQVFASGLKESLELLQGAHAEPVAAAHFAAVRARVMAELEGARQPWWRKVWVYGLAAAAAALFLILALRPGPPAPVHHLAVQAPPPAAPVEAPPVVPRVASHVQRKSATRRPHLEVSVRPPLARAPDLGPPVVVKLVTDDPDVVIYWITDKSGE